MARLLSVVVLGFAALVSAELGWKNVSPEKAPGAPRNRYAHASAVHGNSILITHGYFYDNQRGQMGKQTWMDDTWLYNPKSGWEQVHTTGPVPDPRYGHTFERIGDQFYLFGGDDGTVKESPNNFIPNPHEDLWRLSLSTKTWEEIPKSGKWPKARASHAAWVHDGKMYIFGGYQGHSDLWKFDPETNEWQEIVPKGDHPGVRFSIEAVVPEGADTAYIFGGYRQGNANMQDLWGFHIPTSKWTMIRADGIVEGHVPRKRGAYALAPHGSMFYMFAGAECQPVCTCYNDVWIFDPESALWEEIDVGRRKPPTRYKHSMNVLPDGTALIFGGEGYRFVSDYHNDVWQLGPVDALGWRLFGLFALALVVAIYVAVKMFSAKSTKKGGYSQLMSDGLQGDSKLN